MFSSWQTLSSDPTDTAARQSVISQAQMLSQTYQTVTTQLEQLQANLQTVVQGNPQYTVGQGVMATTVNGATTTSSVTTANPIATDVEVLNTPQSSSSNFQIKFTASEPASGGPASYELQLETSGENPTPIGAPVTISSPGGTYTLGDPNGFLVSVQASDPSTLVPAGSLTNGSTYTQTDSFTPPGGQLEELNGYAYQVDQLNQQIVSDTASGQSTNTLLDQRDYILDQMSNLANISYSPDASGAVSVNVGNVPLVSSTGASTR
ncbi:FlgK family flagellar hook-associated protein [Alicyclobacillus fastidiosus]|uniref:FlgK family flagellar hook-associated protein n=1 Tax=Alicyclobacillus fastidiosus TaxID=392011 RepID=UPI003D67781C